MFFCYNFSDSCEGVSSNTRFLIQICNQSLNYFSINLNRTWLLFLTFPLPIIFIIILFLPIFLHIFMIFPLPLKHLLPILTSDHDCMLYPLKLVGLQLFTLELISPLHVILFENSVNICFILSKCTYLKRGL